MFCHLNESFTNKGLSYKSHDIGYYACYNCHNAIDGRDKRASEIVKDDKYFYLLRGVIRTWVVLIENGILNEYQKDV